MKGVSFTGLLTIVFIALKLTGYIDWDWIWVLAPTWISILLSIIIIAVMFGIAAATGGKVTVRKR